MKIDDYFAHLTAYFLESIADYIDDIGYMAEYIKICEGKIYIVGNGGSAETASHFATDLVKNCGIRAISLVDNSGLVTALSNDIDFSKSYSEQLKLFGTDQDILMIISVSGNSKNLVEAAKVAKRIGMIVFALLGFSGSGQVAECCDKYIGVGLKNYEMVEDIHLAIAHSISSYLKGRR